MGQSTKQGIAAVLLALAGTTGAIAQDRVVNVSGQDALCNGCTWAPLAVAFEAGSYLVTPVMAGSVPGAQYTAYNYGGGRGWSSAYSIALDRDHIVGYGQGGPASGTGWSDEATAFAHTASGAFVLAQAQTVYFGVGDSFYGDNSGGVSLQVTAVPEPAAAALMLAGLGLMGLTGLARRQNRK